MKKQTRLLSFIESIFNAAFGILISFLVQMWIFPHFGIIVSPMVNIKITFVFFLVSLIRSYFFRRFFDQVVSQFFK